MASDRALEDRTSKSWTRQLKNRISSIWNQVFQAIVTTVVLGIGFTIFNDFIAPIPDLTGRWKFTVVYEETADSKFQGLNVTYEMIWDSGRLQTVRPRRKTIRPRPYAELRRLRWGPTNRHRAYRQNHSPLLLPGRISASIQRVWSETRRVRRYNA